MLPFNPPCTPARQEEHGSAPGHGEKDRVGRQDAVFDRGGLHDLTIRCDLDTA